MSDPEEIVRFASRGDGVTASGQHVAGAAPGDMILADGQIERGPHYAQPPCRHYERCGGCQLQHCDDEALADFAYGRVVHMAQKHGFAPKTIAPTHLSPPRSRRRASLHAMNGGGRAAIGFRQARSHATVDLKECHILVPELFALIEPLRAYLTKRKGKYSASIELTLIDQGVDCTIKGLEIEGLEQTEDLLDLCRDQSLARLSLDQGYGAEAFWEPEPVSITLGKIPVDFPAGGFLQATADGEAALVSAAREWLDGCTHVADLFAGLGTFAFALCENAQVTAYEAARDACLASNSAAKIRRVPVEAVHRDLFRNPVRAEELAKFDGVVLDPPRAGAVTQVAQLAESSVERVVYISCNPSSWARDCELLSAAGYELAELRPVGQFRWSTHVELASLFIKR